jgi:hypothetical protein
VYQPSALQTNGYEWRKPCLKVAIKTIYYTRKEVRKEWFDEECEKVHEDDNASKDDQEQRTANREKPD